MTNQTRYNELLDVFRIGLIHGIIDRQEIIDWADVIMLTEAEPDYGVMELSLVGSKSDNEILTLLNTCIGDKKTSIPGRVILGFLYRQLLAQKIDLKKTINAVFWLIHESELTEKDKQLIYRLDHHYDLAVANIYGTVDNVRTYTHDVLELYSGFTIADFAEWKRIDAEVNVRVDGFDRYPW